MEILNRLYDKRIKALNVLFEMSIEEYNQISSEIIEKNEFQRRRVKSSSTIYSLLKSDLLAGCVIPPIVLAISSFKSNSVEDEKDEDIIKHLNENQGSIIILDGLQRTYTIRDLINELKEKGDDESLKTLLKYKLRIETYIGIDKLGILYRMLTLNTGQTPMSIRHQIEILYSDYLLVDFGEIKFVTEATDAVPTKFGEYKFKDIVEGFNSYLERNYLTIDRFDILDNVKSLEKLSKENQDNDLFKAFAQSYHNLVKVFIEANPKWEYSDENNLTFQPFGKSIEKILVKSQVMTGFGSAIGKLIDFDLLNSIGEVDELVIKIDLRDIENDLTKLITKLDKIKSLAKKIGNDQRMYFHFLFRELFDKKADAYLNLSLAIDEAYASYERKTR